MRKIQNCILIAFPIAHDTQSILYVQDPHTAEDYGMGYSDSTFKAMTTVYILYGSSSNNYSVIV